MFLRYYKHIDVCTSFSPLYRIVAWFSLLLERFLSLQHVRGFFDVLSAWTCWYDRIRKCTNSPPYYQSASYSQKGLLWCETQKRVRLLRNCSMRLRCPRREGSTYYVEKSFLLIWGKTRHGKCLCSSEWLSGRQTDFYFYLTTLWTLVIGTSSVNILDIKQKPFKGIIKR